ncbi:MAG: hypothetical protein KDC80_23550 [Saprospiraceae bacterium]|nr:hypothetical protein [Saprospiraceae bacterium]
MIEQIKMNLQNPRELEKLYRNNKLQFKKTFDQLFPEIQDNQSAQFWNERLNFDHTGITWGTPKELYWVLALSFIAGLIARIPLLFDLDENYFYPRNLAFIVFPAMMIYFARKESLNIKKSIFIGLLLVISVIYINILPINSASDTLVLACIHLPIFTWGILGFTFTGNEFGILSRRIDFLRFNGDLLIMTTVLLIAGGVLSAVTVGLFELINLNIEEFYFANVAIWGAAAAPVVGTYLVRTNPQLVKNVSPVIARVFTPLVLVMIITYLIAIIYTGKDPYNDREFLLIFNLLLIGVMAIILFSISETSINTGNKLNNWLLLVLSLTTIVLNGIALSAILFRISEWGITPNRIAVLASNMLIIINLTLVAFGLFKSIKNPQALLSVENIIARFLPIYWIWIVIVVFVFPVLFGFA